MKETRTETFTEYQSLSDGIPLIVESPNKRRSSNQIVEQNVGELLRDRQRPVSSEQRRVDENEIRRVLDLPLVTAPVDQETARLTTDEIRNRILH